MTSQGATLVEPSRIRWAGQGVTKLGCAERVKLTCQSANVSKIVKLFNAAGIETYYEEDVSKIVWGKLLVNAGVNPLTAIFDVNNGALVREGERLGVKTPLNRLLVELVSRKAPES